MKKYSALAVIFFACVATAQNRVADWTTFAGDAQRSGWEKTDSEITKDTVKDFQLVWKMKLENQPKGQRSLTPPVVIGRLISYRGFKELAFVGGSSDNLYAINADLGKMFFHRQLTYSSDQPQANDPAFPCGSGLTAIATLTPPLVPGAARGRGAAPARGGGGGLGASRPVFVLSSDGRLHRLNTSNGDDQAPPAKFLPANAKASSLNMADGIVYTTTNQGCGAAPNAVWAIDWNEAEAHVSSFASNGGGFWGIGGVALGADGTVFAQTGDGPLDPASNKWSNTLLALTSRDLKPRQYFTPPDIAAAAPKNVGMNATTPVVFTYKGRELVVACGKDGRLYVLDAASLGGDDHHTFLSRTTPLTAGATADRGIWGGLASWEGADGARWVLAPVWGPLHSDLKAAATNAATPNGSIVAFKVEEQGGKPMLTPVWVSRDMTSPQPPVIANGVVFAVSSGEYTRQIKEAWGVYTADERPKGATHATLYALDAASGKEIYSSRNLVTAPAALTGLTVANGRALFGTIDSTFYAFGLYMEH